MACFLERLDGVLRPKQTYRAKGLHSQFNNNLQQEAHPRTLGDSQSSLNNVITKRVSHQLGQTIRALQLRDTSLHNIFAGHFQTLQWTVEGCDNQANVSKQLTLSMTLELNF